ncbi:MAG: glycosyltransferase family 4 protein [Actinomycetota bacterium]|nr:glycosyltransferase family 4 protein [Actinomycetota bacterium]
MRVAVVCPYALSAPGGVQGQVTSLASTLAGLGCEVAVAAPDAVGREGEDGAHAPLSLRGVTVISSGRPVAVPANGSRAPVALSPLAARRALRELRDWGPDVLHVHEPLVPAISLASVRSGLAPVVGTFHRAGAGAFYRMARPLARACVASIDELVAVSDAARETLVSVAGPRAARCAVVPNGVDTTRFAGADPWPASGPTVVFVGRVERRKGLGVLLEAFTQLAGDVRLWVVGDGPDLPALRAGHRGDVRIEWCGRLGDDLLARRVAGADVLVAPSLGGESFGVVLLEAMAARTAVVASDLAGYRLAAGDAAAYSPPGDALALARELGELLGGDAARHTLVERGRLRVERYAIAAVARSYLDRYERLVGGRAGTT